jgi:glycine dehydrogenase subunit 2
VLLARGIDLPYKPRGAALHAARTNASRAPEHAPLARDEPPAGDTVSESNALPPIDGTRAHTDRALLSPSDRIARGIQFEEPLIFDRSVPGRRGFTLSSHDWDVPAIDVAQALGGLERAKPAQLPEVSEPEVVRHYTRMSQWNYSIDTGLYPLGSCTMKYNPKINEAMARLPGFAKLHPYAPDSWCQGALELLHNFQTMLCAISGLPGVSLQPAAGAQGELTGLMTIAAYHRSRGDLRRTRVIVPDSAHGTNPASAAFNGFTVVEVKAGADGMLHPDAVAAVMDDTVACIMLTNPNTMGLFERHIAEITRIVHERGGMVYMDGANMNAILGKARPGDFGVDVMHYNVHKTFSTPHGGGGPGAGPICTCEALIPFLPVPRVARVEGEAGSRATYKLDWDHPRSIGKVKAFWGNFLVFVRAYTYLREYGSSLHKVSELAVLNANYLRVKLHDVLKVAYPGTCMHEVVFDDSTFSKNVSTLDIAKRLIDYGFHPPTTYFPLNVHGSLMVEPTETETIDTLDQFAATLRTILCEAEDNPHVLKTAPHNAFRTRLDETSAARKPVLSYNKIAR